MMHFYGILNQGYDDASKINFVSSGEQLCAEKAGLPQIHIPIGKVTLFFVRIFLMSKLRIDRNLLRCRL